MRGISSLSGTLAIFWHVFQIMSVSANISESILRIGKSMLISTQYVMEGWRERLEIYGGIKELNSCNNFVS